MSITYFIISLSIFSLGFFLITIFGYSIIILIQKDLLKEKISLVIILKSFAIGVCVYLCYLMLITILRCFNFFTTYLQRDLDGTIECKNTMAIKG